MSDDPSSGSSPYSGYFEMTKDTVYMYRSEADNSPNYIPSGPEPPRVLKIDCSAAGQERSPFGLVPRGVASRAMSPMAMAMEAGKVPGKKMTAEEFCRLLETGAANLPGKLPNGRGPGNLPIGNPDKMNEDHSGRDQPSGNLPSDQFGKLPKEAKDQFGRGVGNWPDYQFEDLPGPLGKPSGSMPGNLPNVHQGEGHVGNLPKANAQFGQGVGNWPDNLVNDMATPNWGDMMPDLGKLPIRSGKLIQGPYLSKVPRPETNAWPAQLFAHRPAKKSGKLLSGKFSSGKLPKEESGKPNQHSMMEEVSLTSGNMPGKLPPLGKLPTKLPTKLPKGRSSSGPSRKSVSKELQEIGLPGTSGLSDLPMGQSISRVERLDGGGSDEEVPKPMNKKKKEEPVMLFKLVKKDKDKKEAKKGILGMMKKSKSASRLNH